VIKVSIHVSWLLNKMSAMYYWFDYLTRGLWRSCMISNKFIFSLIYPIYAPPRLWLGTDGKILFGASRQHAFKS